MAAQINAILESLDKKLHEKNKLTELLEVAEQKTGLKRLYIASGGVGILALWLIFGYGAQLLCNSIGFIYPAYASVKAIESPPRDDDTKWLMYWVVFSLFSVVEFFSDILLNWFPLYWLAKCLFLLWCFIPFAGNGTNVIYNRVVRPLFLKHQGQVDNLLNKAANAATNIASKAAAELKND
ncbi:Receptor expression-enhancing protein 5 [Orchesella cincta]|uniref:Receptor expression-enhancing protein n=1 Tax=Orchesella cincta TaxID=48709 RepID=A0A1D2NIA8_ORCCI|nr:Receptor expression-enhancing protein 5 [Orchesella cincta]